MFDTIYCERKLPITKVIKKAFPDRDWTKQDFQTKDLDNTMTSYYIKKNGYLYTEKVEGEHVRTMTEEEEKKAKKQGKWCWPYKFIEHSRTSVKQDITATINFYDYSNDKAGNTWEIEFEAEFIKGKLVSIKLVEGEIIHTAEQNAENERKWKAKVDAYENHPWTRTKKILNKITFGYWSKLWHRTSKGLGRISHVVHKLQMWVLRNMY